MTKKLSNSETVDIIIAQIKRRFNSGNDGRYTGAPIPNIKSPNQRQRRKLNRQVFQ